MAAEYPRGVGCVNKKMCSLSSHVMLWALLLIVFLVFPPAAILLLISYIATMVKIGLHAGCTCAEDHHTYDREPASEQAGGPDSGAAKPVYIAPDWKPDVEAIKRQAVAQAPREDVF